MNEIQRLAMRVQCGDPSATALFRNELESKVKRIVRRTVRTRAPQTPLARQILAEADHLLPVPQSTSRDQEWIVERVSGRICEVVVNRLNPALAPDRAAHETVRE